MTVDRCASEDTGFAVVSYGVRVRIVDHTNLGLRQLLSIALPKGLAEILSADVGPFAETLVIEPTDTSDDDGSPRFRLLSDGVCKHEEPADRVLRHVTGGVDAAVAKHCREWLFVHAGVVAWRNYAILVPGRSRSGKTTMVLEMIRRGATYYSDEYAVLDGEGRVHPYARVPTVRDAEGGFRPAHAEQLDASAKPPLPIALILAANYHPSAAWQPEVLRGSRAVLPLIDGAVLAQTEPRRTIGLAARLAPHVITLQGPRPDAAAIAPRVLRLVDDAIVARAFARRAPGEAVPLAPTLAAVARVRCQSIRHRESADGGPVVPAPYVRFESFLSAEEHRRVLAFARAREADFAASQVTAADGSHKVDPQYRESRTLYDLDEIWAIFEERVRRLLPHVRRELGMPWFPVGEVERQLTAHQEGGHFGPHSDNGSGPVAGRVLTCVYHFHASPRQFVGGDLHLYGTRQTPNGHEPASTYVALVPLDNSLVFFSSGTQHAVCPVRSSGGTFAHARFALNIWFHAGEDKLAAHRRPAVDAGHAAKRSNVA